MICRMYDLRYKDVINIHDGRRLGSVCDIDIDTSNACINALVIYGRPRFLGLFGREEDIVIKWCNIQSIGDDIIIVDCNFGTNTGNCSPPRNFWRRRN